MEMFFQPQSVVLIGVSRQSGPGAYNNLEMMLRYGYKGRIYLVHPKVNEILGLKTYRSVEELPETPELAVLSVGRDRVLPVFTECANKGIRRIIVISQGFADADDRGKELQAQMAEMAKKHGIRVVGPNTMGVLNVFSGFSTAFIDIERDPSPPPFTMVLQSGVFQVGYESFTGRIGKAIDVGNCCDVDFVDVLEYLENDPQTRVIFIHMEGMKRGREFLRVAARLARKKPIIVLKTGRSTAGAQAALSHTGSLVGEDAVVDSAFARAGLIRVRNMVELLAVSKAFKHYRSISGPRVGVVTATGACGIMTADACQDHGMELAPFPEAIGRDLENQHIAWHKLRNPVDLWPLGMVGGSFVDVFKRAVKGLLEDERVDAVLGIAPSLSSELHADLDMASAVREVNGLNTRHKPIAMWLYGGDENRQAKALRDEPDVACFATIDEAIMGMAALWNYKRIQKGAEQKDDLFAAPAAQAEGAPPSLPSIRLPSEAVLVGEACSEILRAYGIPLVSGKPTPTVESAVSFAAGIGYPVVLKIISPQWLHKSDAGGIRLNVKDESQLRSSYEELLELFSSRTPQATLDAILVQKQIKGTELLLGIKRDPQLGPVLVAGMGGIYTEVFQDIARELAPCSSNRAEKMLRSLRIYPILKGIRGQSGVDLEALIQTMISLSRLAMEHPDISELDLNPVIANPEGCWCVDSRIVVG